MTTLIIANLILEFCEWYSFVEPPLSTEPANSAEPVSSSLSSSTSSLTSSTIEVKKGKSIKSPTLRRAPTATRTTSSPNVEVQNVTNVRNRSASSASSITSIATRESLYLKSMRKNGSGATLSTSDKSPIDFSHTFSEPAATPPSSPFTGKDSSSKSKSRSRETSDLNGNAPAFIPSSTLISKTTSRPNTGASAKSFGNLFNKASEGRQQKDRVSSAQDSLQKSLSRG